MSRPGPTGRLRLWVEKSFDVKPPALGATIGEAGNEYDSSPADEAVEEASAARKRGEAPVKLDACKEWARRLIRAQPVRVKDVLAPWPFMPTLSPRRSTRPPGDLTFSSTSSTAAIRGACRIRPSNLLSELSRPLGNGDNRDKRYKLTHVHRQAWSKSRERRPRFPWASRGRKLTHSSDISTLTRRLLLFPFHLPNSNKSAQNPLRIIPTVRTLPRSPPPASTTGLPGSSQTQVSEVFVLLSFSKRRRPIGQAFGRGQSRYHCTVLPGYRPLLP